MIVTLTFVQALLLTGLNILAISMGLAAIVLNILTLRNYAKQRRLEEEETKS